MQTNAHCAVSQCIFGYLSTLHDALHNGGGVSALTPHNSVPALHLRTPDSALTPRTPDSALTPRTPDSALIPRTPDSAPTPCTPDSPLTPHNSVSALPPRNLVSALTIRDPPKNWAGPPAAGCGLWVASAIDAAGAAVLALVTLISHAIFGMVAKSDQETPQAARVTATPSWAWPQRATVPHHTLPASQPRRLWYGRKG
eukprot:289841-Chlamydomonas_euryale.AAC.1